MSSLEYKQQSFLLHVYIRWVCVLVIVFLLLGLEKKMPESHLAGVWFILMILGVYNLILHLLGRSQNLAGPLTLVGFLIDGLLTSWGVAITGGPLSVFIPFYLFIIITACLVVSPRIAAVTAFVQIALFLGTLWICFQNHIPSDFSLRNSNLFYGFLESASPEIRRGIYFEQALRWSFYFLLTALICGLLVRQVWDREEQLRSRERALEQKRHLIRMGELTGRIAHGVNTPLGLISGNLEILMTEIRKDSKAYKTLTQIEQYVQRAIKTVRDLLDYNRQTLSEIKPTFLHQVIQTVVTTLQPKLKKTGGRLILDVDPKLPPITAYPDGLYQMIWNLAENAADSISPGGIITLSAHFQFRSVRLSPEDRRGEIKVVVRDTGKGIPPVELKKIFEPFYSTKGFGKGTGLGLAIVKRIVNEHHGDIKVESRVGEGTVFTLLLPTEGLAREDADNTGSF